jgi:hypothetical protein
VPRRFAAARLRWRTDVGRRRSPGAKDVFAEWLALRGTGEAPELDELCRSHPALAPPEDEAVEGG